MIEAMLPTLVELASLLAASATGRAPRGPALPRAPGDASWIARYPEALAPALRQLASVVDDADAIARRRLASDLSVSPVWLDEGAALDAKRSRRRTPGVLTCSRAGSWRRRSCP